MVLWQHVMLCGNTLLGVQLARCAMYESKAIPLLFIQSVQPVQSLSACTVQLYLYSSYRPYGLYRA